MKTIIVYYSLEGNTEYAANQIAEVIGADLLRIMPKKAYPTNGLRKFLWGGKSAVMGETPELLPYHFDASAYDRIIIGFPVWAGNFAPPIRTYLLNNNLHDKHIAAFACQSGAGAEKALSRLRVCLGIESFEAELVLIDPKDKPNEDNTQKILDFCTKLSNSQ